MSLLGLQRKRKSQGLVIFFNLRENNCPCPFQGDFYGHLTPCFVKVAWNWEKCHRQSVRVCMHLIYKPDLKLCFFVVFLFQWQPILESGAVELLCGLTQSENPALRVNGIWALMVCFSLFMYVIIYKENRAIFKIQTEECVKMCGIFFFTKS